jgi:hypothetical protein
VKTLTWNRLARLEAQRSHPGTNTSDSKQFKFKMAVMSIVAFHAGGMTPADSFATALARGLSITARELKSALNPDNDDRLDVWALVLDKLNDLSVSRGCPPIFEDGSFTVEGSRDDHDRRDGLDVLDQLYEEIPEEVRERHRLLPHLAGYLA